MLTKNPTIRPRRSIGGADRAVLDRFLRWFDYEVVAPLVDRARPDGVTAGSIVGKAAVLQQAAQLTKEDRRALALGMPDLPFIWSDDLDMAFIRRLVGLIWPPDGVALDEVQTTAARLRQQAAALMMEANRLELAHWLTNAPQALP